MSSVPGEVLRDVLLPLDRCAVIHVNSRPEKQISYAHEDSDVRCALLFAEFTHALRSSRVANMSFRDLVFAPEMVALVLRAPIVVGALSVYGGSFAKLSSTEFHEIFLHFSPTSLDITACYIRACQVTDEFLRTLSKKRVRRAKFPNMTPVLGGKFCVTDDTIIDFCAQEDVPIGQEGGAARPRELVVCFGRFTKGIFKRLIEASTASARTQALRVVVSQVRFDEEDLRDFAQDVSYCDRGKPWETRIYDFPEGPHGAVSAMHLQIVLHPDKRLEMIRGQRPNPLFYQ